MLFQHRMAIAILAVLPLTAQAQQGASAPTDPAAAVPPPVYESAFTGYQPLHEEKETPDKTWRRVNEEIGSLGGHAGHTRKTPDAAKSPAPPASVQETSKVAPAPAGHDMHRHGGK